MESVRVRRDQLIVVEWADHPYVGKTQAVLARTITHPPLDQLQKGCELLVKMGKSASARAWKAFFRGTAEELTVDETQQSTCDASAGIKEVQRKRSTSKKAGGKKPKLQSEGKTTKPKTEKPSADVLDIGSSPSTDEEDVVIEIRKPDWKSPFHEEAKPNLLEEIHIAVDGMNKRLCNIENLLQACMYRNPTPCSSSSDSSGLSFGSPTQMYTPAGHLPMEPLFTGGEICNSQSRQCVTPEAEGICPNQEEPCTPEFQYWMSSLGIEIVGDSVPRQQEVLPQLTHSDVVTNTTSTPISQAPTSSAPISQEPTSSTQVPTSITPVSQAPTSSTPISQAPTSSAPVSQAPTSSATTTSQAIVCQTPRISTSSSQQVPSLDDLCQTLGLSPNLVRVLDQGSNSRQNLAVNLVRKVYTEKERETPNVNGRKGKRRLDPLRMNIVRKLAYNLKPLKPGENEEEDWRKYCTKAIDSANRKQ